VIDRVLEIVDEHRGRWRVIAEFFGQFAERQRHVEQATPRATHSTRAVIGGIDQEIAMPDVTNPMAVLDSSAAYDGECRKFAGTPRANVDADPTIGLVGLATIERARVP
jgi:hypothetical protein